ncbi:DUF4838 domain-containing protein [Mesonia mobilis]|uniref:DUF4838 domain-containing protein n=1 Tax=Mesonia mobilis TaxID=369791 RepID=UPI0026E9D2E6|nr:DUF4838 domain-containing protein [Mesonia mobilis]
MRNHLLQRKQIFTLMVFLSLFFNSFAQKESFSYRESYFPMVSASKAFQLKYDTMPLDRYWGLWGHNLYKWVEKDEASENEEIYAFIDDERNCDQFCFSSSILKEIIQKNIRKTKSAYTYYMVSPQDNTLVCQCEKCIEAGNTATNAAPAVFNLLQDLAKEHQDLQFFTTAYLSVKTPPKEKQTENIGVFYSTIQFQEGKAYQELKNKQELSDELTAWKDKLEHIFVWEYALNYDNYFDFYPNLKDFQQNLKFLKDHGVDGVFINGSESYSALQDIKCATTARLLKEPDLKLNEVLTEEFNARYPKEVAKITSEFYENITEEFSNSTKKMGIYSGINDAYRKYLHPEALESFYRQLKPLTSEPQDFNTESLLLSVAFLRLELMRYFGVNEFGYGTLNANKITIKPEVHELLKVIEQTSKSTKITTYNEQNAKISDYLKFWRSDILTQSTNYFLNTKINVLSNLDEGYSAIKVLNDGSIGFLDYNTNWLINSIDDLEIEINTEDLEEINTIKFGFLNDPAHHIYLPEEIIISSDEHRKKLKLKSSTLKEKKTVNFPVDFKPGKKLIIKILRRKNSSVKSQIATDEISIN